MEDTNAIYFYDVQIGPVNHGIKIFTSLQTHHGPLYVFRHER